MPTEVIHDLLQLINPVKCIHFRDVFLHLLPVAFCQATHNEDMFELAFTLGPGILKYCINGFLFGISNKATGINNHRVEAFDGGRIKRDF